MAGPNESDTEANTVLSHDSTTSSITTRIFWRSMILAAGGFVGLVDSSIIAIAVPDIASDFDAPVNVVQWTSSGYLLAMATVIPLTSSLCHRYGAQRTWVVSLVVFTGATLAAGLAWSLGSLIVFRVIQGLGGGMLFPLMRLLAVEIAGQSRMGRVMALTAVPVQVAPIVGPVLGGVIIDQSSWRWALWASIPLALIALIPAAVWIPNRLIDDVNRVDYWSILVLMPSVTIVILFLTRVSSSEFSVSTFIFGIIAVCLLFGFFRRAKSSTRSIGFELTILRIKSFRATSLIVFSNNFSMMGVTFLIPLIIETSDPNESVITVGLSLAPQGIGTLLSVLYVGKKIDVSGDPRRLVFAGLTGVAITTFGLAVYAHNLSAPAALVLLLIRGIALAFAVAPTMLTLYAGLPTEKYAEATTTNAIVQQIAVAFGAAFAAVSVQVASQYASDRNSVFSLVFAALAIITAATLLSTRGLPTKNSG